MKRFFVQRPLDINQINITFITLVMLIFVSGCTDPSNTADENPASDKMLLNDTGAVFYTRTFSSSTTDPIVENLLTATPDLAALGQDADFGRDITHNNALNGNYGFDFTKLDQSGKPLSDQTVSYSETPWACVKDNVTGLIWEVKTTSGLQMSTHSYTWYEPDDSINGGFAGSFGETDLCGDDYLLSCDTQSYITAINNLVITNPTTSETTNGLCGLTQWRLPLREELRSLIDYGTMSGVVIDTNFFPNTSATDTWTSQTSYYNTTDGVDAWEIHFDTARSESHEKSSKRVVVRLVHSSQ